jgi:Tol biopolymer transport system component/DNA-binding winged helix-turn-helix (wHTH) protein
VSHRIRFDGIEVHLRTGELFRSGRRVRVPQQSFRVLTLLLENAGELVTREELRAKLWPAGTLVEYDQGLNAAIKRLREALGDSAETPRFIETLPKRGYRFIAPIQADGPPPPATATPTHEPAGLVPAPAPPINGMGADATIATEPVSIPASAAPSASGRRGGRGALVAAASGLSAILLVAIVLWAITHRSAAPPPSGRQVIPFTSLPGQEIAPTFSPDGSQIAFAWNGEPGADQQFDLYVKSLASERLLRLTHHPARWLVPAWSPDGRAIAFIRHADDRSGIFVIPALGGAERRIVSTGVAVGAFRQLSWSPDGKSLAYSAYGPKGVAQVYVVAVDSLQIQPVSPAPDCVDATNAVFSPEGKRLALVCLSSAAVYSIRVRELPDGPITPLATIMGYPQGLAWSVDGNRLIFSNDPGDGGELWQLTLDGRLTQLPFGESSSAPAIARDGRVAYVRGRNTINIWRADLTADDPEASAVKLIYSTVSQRVPRYSPDGAHIAFESNRSGTNEIWMANAEGSDSERLTSFNGPMTSSPSWCSDGRRIAFDSRASGTSAIYIEDISERVPRKVLTSQPNLSSPVWSQDCRWLLAHDASPRLYRFPSAGGPATRVTERSSMYSVVVRDRVVFNVTQANGVVLWSKPVEGGREQPLEGMPRLRYDDAWVATPNGVYYTDSSSKPVSVHFYEFASRTTRRLMTLKQTPIPGGGPAISVSPDGRWLLFSQTDDEQSDIMLAQDQ